MVEFEWRGDVRRRYDEVVREVNGLRSSLPNRLGALQVKRVDPREVSTMQVALISDVLPERRLEKVARALRDRLNQAPGVRQAHTWGAPASEIRVSLDMGRLQELRLPVERVVQALQTAGEESPIGAIHVGERRFNIEARGAFRSLDDVAAVLVTSVDGRPVHVRDIATVSWAGEEQLYLTRFNGHRAQFVTITQKDGIDVSELNAHARAVIADFRRTLPASVRLTTVFSQDEEVRRRLDHLYRDFGLALLLVIVTLLPLGLRASLVVMISIPLSLLTGVAALSFLGFTLNQVSIAGFILALGLLVDDAIVVTENIVRRIRAGEDRTSAAIHGVQQIATAVVGCTATLLCPTARAPTSGHCRLRCSRRSALRSSSP
jgi:multidrug efflux pump subunit AcrB